MAQRDMTFGVHLKTRREGQQAYTATQRDLKAVEDRAQKMTQAFKRFGGESVREMTRAQGAAKHLERAFEQAGRGIERGLSRGWMMLQRLGRGVERFLVRGMQVGGVAVAGLTAAIISGGAAFADYEQNISNAVTVTGLVGEAAAVAKTALSELGLELAKTSRYGSADVAASFYDLSSAGFEVQQTMQAMPGIIALAESTLADLSFTTETVARALTVFQLEGTESNRVANVFAAGAAASMLQIYDLAEAMSYASPLAAGLGMSIEETTAALAMLSQGGIIGSRAGTTLMGFLAELSTQEEKGQKTLKKYGLEMKDLDVKSRGFGAVLKTLSDAQITANDSMELFGRRAGPGALLFIQQGASEFERLTNRVTGTNDAFSMQTLQNQTLQGSWMVLMSAVKDARVEFGQGLNPMLTSVVSNLGKMIAKAREADVFTGLGTALATIGKPVGDVAGEYGGKAVDALIGSQDEIAAKAGEIAQKIADWFTVPGEGGQTGFGKFADDLRMMAEAAWEFSTAIAGASWDVIVAAAEKLSEKMPEIVAGMEALIPKVDALADRMTQFLDGEEWQKFKGHMSTVSGILDFMAAHPFWTLMGLLMGPSALRGLGGAIGKGVGGLLTRTGGRIGKALGFGGKAAETAVEGAGAATKALKTLPQQFPILSEVEGPGAAYARDVATRMAPPATRAPGLLGRAMGGAGRMLGRLSWPLTIASKAWSDVREGRRFGRENPQATPMEAMQAYVRRHSYGDEIVNAVQTQGAAAETAGYGVTIVIQTNDESRIGQIAQDEYSRARAAQRRQLVR